MRSTARRSSLSIVPARARRRWIALWLLSALGATSCYSTRSVPRANLADLNNGGRSDEIVLASGQARRVRIRPSSWIRFIQANGDTTAWIEAKDLRVTRRAAVIEPRLREGVAGTLPWDDLTGFEVNDLDMGRTFVGVVSGTALVVVALAAETLIVAALGSVTRGSVHEVGLTRSVLDAVIGAAGERPSNSEPAEDVEAASPASAPTITEAAEAAPLFSPAALRRDWLESRIGIEAGVDSTKTGLFAETSAFATLRFWRVLEVGGGISVTSGSPLVGSPDPHPGPTRVVPRLRVGLLLDVDAAGRLSLTLGQEVGASLDGRADTRSLVGARVRIGDRWQLGILPVNPRISWSRTAASQISYVSAVDLAWVW